MRPQVPRTERRVTGHRALAYGAPAYVAPGPAYGAPGYVAPGPAYGAPGYGPPGPAYKAPAYYGAAGPAYEAPPEHAYPSVYGADYVPRPPAAIPNNRGSRCTDNLGYGRWGYCN
jgi:hypothetical protein